MNELYPYEQINERLKWFQNIFKPTMNIEKWTIVNFWDRQQMVFVITDTSNTISDIIIKFYKVNKELNQLAKQYGWIVSDEGIITGFDINNLTRNKHLLTANELNLL